MSSKEKQDLARQFCQDVTEQVTKKHKINCIPPKNKSVFFEPTNKSKVTPEGNTLDDVRTNIYDWLTAQLAHNKNSANKKCSYSVLDARKEHVTFTLSKVTNENRLVFATFTSEGSQKEHTFEFRGFKNSKSFKLNRTVVDEYTALGGKIVRTKVKNAPTNLKTKSITGSDHEVISIINDAIHGTLDAWLKHHREMGDTHALLAGIQRGVTLHLGKKVYQNVVAAWPANGTTHKCDFILIAADQTPSDKMHLYECGYFSYKKGNKPSDFQQYGGITKSALSIDKMSSEAKHEINLFVKAAAVNAKYVKKPFVYINKDVKEIKQMKVVERFEYLKTRTVLTPTQTVRMKYFDFNKAKIVKFAHTTLENIKVHVGEGGYMIKSDEIIKQSMYGRDYGNPQYGLNNCEGVLQGARSEHVSQTPTDDGLPKVVIKFAHEMWQGDTMLPDSPYCPTFYFRPDNRALVSPIDESIRVENTRGFIVSRKFRSNKEPYPLI